MTRGSALVARSRTGCGRFCNTALVLGMRTVRHVASACNPVICSGFKGGRAGSISARRRTCGTFFSSLSGTMSTLSACLGRNNGRSNIGDVGVYGYPATDE